jgi:hypothetical protein
MKITLSLRRLSCSGALLAALAFSPAPGHAQAVPLPPSIPPATAPTAGNPGIFNGSNTAADLEQAHMMHKMLKERNTLRQQAIVEDTKHLVELANELKEAVDKSSQDELSLDVVNTANQIEKLAKSVKEKMRDGD